ncbi:hypothetical protein AB6A40_008630 [Gnathostoma spinigerum]|uniref:GrpE protein homolog n=1 Tax=Gnathostoma spinigerum TaxID=75299 RepID=A0ABD6EQ13_9BILA
MLAIVSRSFPSAVAIGCSSRTLSHCIFAKQGRSLLSAVKPCSSLFSFSSPAQDETKQEVKFSLKDGSRYLTSAEFLKKVKEAVGSEVPDEEFIIPRSAFDAVAAEYDALVEERSELKDKYTRALADTENVRKRGQRLIEEAKLFAVQNFCKDLLEVADAIDLAIEATEKEDLEKKSEVKSLLEGVKMTQTVLLKVFEKHGLIKLCPIGEKFDPNLHEAVLQVPKDKTEIKAGHVADVMKIGYCLHGRPIRAPKVSVVAS